MGTAPGYRKKSAPTLYGIIVFKLGKGTLFLALAIFLFCLSGKDLPTEYKRLVDFLRVHPANAFFTNLAGHIAHVTKSGMLWATAGTLFYSMFSLVEGVGLIFKLSWAGWMAIGESGFFIPIEVYELTRPGKASWFLASILVINIIIVWYLVANRHRLFRHHLHHRGSSEVTQADLTYE